MEQRPPRVPKLAWVEEEEKEEEGPGAAPEVETEEVQEFQPLEEGWESVGKDLEQRPPRVPKLAWVEEEEEEEGPEADPELETEEVQQFQPMQEDAAMDQTQEQDLACGLFHGTAQEETSVMGTGSMEDGDVYTSDTNAAMLEFILEEGVSIPEQVPAVEEATGTSGSWPMSLLTPGWAGPCWI
ncbi:X-linked retinitis pigmentosa GTPase regulator-interacting protein 1-like [Cyanistes caeruleus]|uniref:X-linked retinitis pigmentosa GTPase regulator-interacting protein 1-like n=1 Tax=Cyanistes caeruleus TaxID=156563 RepID=UPI000CDB2277|nr:X-linked retinitis pigmentosa GTPase regulator-interacting protein 1-like [Cyanistes caeruleus]